MGTPFTTRVILKIKRTVRELDPAEREFAQIFPMVNAVEGFLRDGQEKWLFKQARALPDGSNLVEIGSYKGRSTTCLGFGCRGTRKRVFAIDTFDGGPNLPRLDSFRQFSANIKRCELSEQVEAIVAASTSVAQTWTRPIHLLFVDGSHNYEDVLADFDSFFPHVVPDGLVAFHDVNSDWPGVYRAWHEVIKHELADVGDCQTMCYGRKPRVSRSKSVGRNSRGRA